ncbi:ribokinase [Bifidobacterium sp. B4001]|uniref:ribokinase n=1 Tax=unclassified Bifidobacterium TaxID=2608897 RepID=UPI00226B7346|nr:MULTISPECIES: ribokinase [unclassified Bifidobacterium]MCX8673205.1 ribokinase [Bifidobacterium sp. B4079]MCX8681638.1 ribokinase [Bifidobacterium sp. B4001]
MHYDVIVLGSINLDVKALVASYPRHGDTATAKSITMLPGGKGSNQAVAAAKLGGKVAMLGAVGEDGAGRQMLDNLSDWSVDTQFVMRKGNEGTGTFIVQVDQTSENTMVGTLGANDTITAAEVDTALDQMEAPVLLMQLETSRESVVAALKAGRRKGMYIILDPAPADGFFPEALAYADCVTPNQQETERITGIHVTDKVEAVKAAKAIAGMGPKTVIAKLGAHGSVVLHEGEIYEIDSVKVHALDSVCAGDVFAGALAVNYAQHGDFLKAVNFANKAAAIKVSRVGNHQVFPTLADMS